MAILLILDIRRVAGSCDRKSHTEKSSALLELFRRGDGRRRGGRQETSADGSRVSEP